LKNSINLIVIDGFPHTSIDILLCQAASFFGIKLLLLYQPNIANKFMYFSHLEGDSGNFSIYYDDSLRPVKNKEREYKVEQPTIPFYMRDFSDFFYTHDKLQYDLAPLASKVLPKFSWVTLMLYCLKLFKNYKNPFQAKTLISIFLKHVSYLIYDDNLKKISTASPDLLQKYVYFALSHQPELTTECMGKEYLDIIAEKTENWEIERVAKMDIILMQMAICELLQFPSIPVKVSLDEYIEISKEYSSPQSKVFINGILDKLVADFKRDNKIQKAGRGLIE
jgi:hypothetical protein